MNPVIVFVPLESIAGFLRDRKGATSSCFLLESAKKILYPKTVETPLSPVVSKSCIVNEIFVMKCSEIDTDDDA